MDEHNHKKEKFQNEDDHTRILMGMFWSSMNSPRVESSPSPSGVLSEMGDWVILRVS